MKKLMGLSALALAVVGTGCISVHRNDGASELQMPQVTKDAVHLKYDVKDTPVTAKATTTSILGFINFGTVTTHIADNAPRALSPFGSDKAANAAYALACDKAKADAIVAARYKITTENYVVYKEITAEITGYPAVFTGVEVKPAK